ncbi:hypothetical protein B0J18DRAFT_434517 [Chaetomium sp. MPI-SDFR-AT-0129]|nr:hypothetical protein B0J18DRAFT_434517 [Chaetomium sp. MPI-SDFR-AT-0129]
MLQDLRRRATQVLGVAGPLLNDGEMNSRKRRLARTVHRLARTLTQLLDDNPSVSDPPPEIPPVDEKPYSLEAIVSSTEHPLRLAALSKGLDFNFFVAEGIKRNPYVVADAGRLRHAISGALASSIQATTCGQIDFYVRENETPLDDPEAVHITFSVRDTSRIQPSAPDTRTASDDQPISHLGTVKYLVEAMRGRIRVDSIPELGTRTMFCIPFVRPSDDDMRELDSHGSNLTVDTHATLPVPYADGEEVVNAIDGLILNGNVTGGHVIM